MVQRTGMTSLPIPSAGIKPILRDCLAEVAKVRKGARNMVRDGMKSGSRETGIAQKYQIDIFRPILR
jgi:hypothetical protein